MVTQEWQWLDEVPDPELPSVSITDLGIVRDVRWEGDDLVVALTPTYSGCPATAVIEADVTRALHDRGVHNVRIERRLSPAWTTDWITPRGRARLHEHGIAPPGRMSSGLGTERSGNRRCVARSATQRARLKSATSVPRRARRSIAARTAANPSIT